MPFQFKSEEVHCIMKACENHTFSGPKPACLANLTQRLTLRRKNSETLSVISRALRWLVFTMALLVAVWPTANT